MSDKMLVENMKKSLAKRELKKVRFRMYTVKLPKERLPFMPPFLALDDDMAVGALIEMSKSMPFLQGKYVYHVADFYPVDGEIVACVPRVVHASAKKVEVKDGKNNA